MQDLQDSFVELCVGRGETGENALSMASTKRLVCKSKDRISKKFGKKDISKIRDQENSKEIKRNR